MVRCEENEEYEEVRSIFSYRVVDDPLSNANMAANLWGYVLACVSNNDLDWAEVINLVAYVSVRVFDAVRQYGFSSVVRLSAESFVNESSRLLNQH